MTEIHGVNLMDGHIKQLKTRMLLRVWEEIVFDKTCISLYVKDMTDMSIKYGWTGHTAIAYFDLAPWAMNSF